MLTERPSLPKLTVAQKRQWVNRNSRRKPREAKVKDMTAAPLAKHSLSRNPTKEPVK